MYILSVRSVFFGNSNILSLQNVLYFQCMVIFDEMTVECNSVNKIG